MEGHKLKRLDGSVVKAMKYSSELQNIKFYIQSITTSSIYIYILVYIYYLLWVTCFDLCFRPSSGPHSNLKCSQSEMLKYKYNLIYGIPFAIIVTDAHITVAVVKF